MANKRMFSVDVTETDAFYSLSAKAQALYLHLGMRADDDGFVSSPVRSCGASKRVLDQLETAGYIIRFDSGVVVVTDWKINNFLRKDRHSKTIFQNELAQLEESPTGRYFLKISGRPNGNQMSTTTEPTWQPNGNQMETQYSIEENRIVESRVEEGSKEKDKQQPTAPPAAVAPHKGALGGSTVLDSSKSTERDSETEAARQRFLNSIKRPAWPAADAATPDVMKEDEES